MADGPKVDKLSRPTSVSVRVDSVLGRRTLGLDLPVANVVIDGTSDRTVPHQLTFDAPLSMLPEHDQSPLANKGQRLHVWSQLEIDGMPYSVDQGWFQIEKWTESRDSVQVTALDLMRTLETDLMRWPSSPPRGSTLRTELQRLAGNLPVQLDAADRSIPTDLQWDRDRVKSIRDLCVSQGLEYAIKPDGYMHVWEHRTGRARTATYTARDLLLDAPRESGERLPNRWLAVGSKTEGSGDDAREVRWSYEAVADYPPYGKDYGIVREVREVESATGQAQVTAAANRMLSDSLVAGTKRSLEIALDPRIELGDVIGVIADGDMFTGRVVAFSKPLDDPAVRMRVDVETLLW